MRTPRTISAPIGAKGAVLGKVLERAFRGSPKTLKHQLFANHGLEDVWKSRKVEKKSEKKVEKSAQFEVSGTMV